MRSDIADWLALANCPGLGPIGYRRIVAHFGSPGVALSASSSALRSIPQVGPEVARSIGMASHDYAATQLEACEKHSVSAITLADSNYPTLLLETFAPPPVLFAKGSMEALDRPTVAVVGARHCSQYGRHIARSFSEELARRGICVVSGMALGIDACAHEGALKGGATAAILGTGLDHPYPMSNLQLFHEICESGVVISEFPMGTTVDPKYFPRRNRTISGISQGVVVVEGGPRSGSLLTAQYALEQDREVFAVPGPVTSAKSLGPHHLIQEGAHLAQSPDDICNEILGSKGSEHTPIVVPETLSGIEGEIVSCLMSGHETHVDTIATEVKIPPHEALSILLTLELEARVRQLPGKHFALAH
jgi:DNA processing protein